MSRTYEFFCEGKPVHINTYIAATEAELSEMIERTRAGLEFRCESPVTAKEMNETSQRI